MTPANNISYSKIYDHVFETTVYFFKSPFGTDNIYKWNKGSHYVNILLDDHMSIIPKNQTEYDCFSLSFEKDQLEFEEIVKAIKDHDLELYDITHQ